MRHSGTWIIGEAMSPTARSASTNCSTAISRCCSTSGRRGRIQTAKRGGRNGTLRGLTQAILLENSTRTVLSFEIAGRRLGAQVATMPVGQSSVSKGESLRDNARTIDAMGADLLVMRHATAGAAAAVAEASAAQ